MSTVQKNLIAGSWQAGSGEIENRNPSDLSDLVGLYAQASSDQLQATLTQAKVAQKEWQAYGCLLYTSPSPRDGLLSRMPSSA